MPRNKRQKFSTSDTFCLITSHMDRKRGKLKKEKIQEKGDKLGRKGKNHESSLTLPLLTDSNGCASLA